MERKFMWLWFAKMGEEKTKIRNALLDGFHDIEKIYRADRDEIAKVCGFTDAELEYVLESRTSFDWQKEMDILEEAEIHFATKEDDEYPDKLRMYADVPMWLFYKGHLPKEHIPIVAMVGARACSNYGRTMAKNIGRELSVNGVQVVSGMARGIDTYSQLGAIEGGTPTFAVLGCGVDICYPTENIELYEDILNHGGGIISEYYPGTEPLAWHFPMRNRIISGLADKVAVIEAKEKSGSLITVEWALEQGKDIYALPGRVNDMLSAGCNRLLKTGAGVLTSGKDILNDLNYDTKKIVQLEKEGYHLGKELAKVYVHLDINPKSVEVLIKETGLLYEELMEKLIKLQFIGLVEEIATNYYAKIK